MPALWVPGQATGDANMGGGSTLPVPYPSANAAGSRLVAAASWGGSGTATITDSRGNTWVPIVTLHDSSNNQQFGTFECLNAATGSNTVTLNTAGVGFRWMLIDEGTGFDTSVPAQHSVIKQASATAAANNATSNPVTPTDNGSALWACAMEDAVGSVTPNAGTGWTLRHNETTSMTSEAQVQTTAAPISATWTMSGSTSSYMAVLLAFKPAGGGGGTPSAGSGAGTLAWAGAAAGSRSASGSGAGSVTFAGSAAGSRPSQGSGAATLTWAGTATGSAPTVDPHAGSGAGSLAWAGAATGTRASEGTGAGTLAWTGASTGDAPTVGTNAGGGAGTLAWAGTATGSRQASGSGTSTMLWTGTAAGSKPSLIGASGSGSGTIAWAGSAAGSRASAGGGVGLLEWVGSTAAGARSSSGTGAGLLTWIGAATGRNITEVRDVTVLSITDTSRVVTITDTSRVVTILEVTRPFTITGGLMYLKAAAREFYSLAIVTEPAVTAWEASFDGGTTYVAGEVDGDSWRWLLAGPDAEAGDATVLTGTASPLLRAVDNPEIVVRDAPRVYVT